MIDLVIKIPEEEYKILSEMSEKEKVNELSYYERLIANGTPLPNRHGRLMILSENAIEKELMPLSFSCQKWISEVGLSNATVSIIEAERENKE